MNKFNITLYFLFTAGNYIHTSDQHHYQNLIIQKNNLLKQLSQSQQDFNNAISTIASIRKNAIKESGSDIDSDSEEGKKCYAEMPRAYNTVEKFKEIKNLLIPNIVELQNIIANELELQNKIDQSGRHNNKKKIVRATRIRNSKRFCEKNNSNLK